MPDVVARNRSTRQTWVYPGNGQGGFAARRGPFSAPSGVDRLLSPGQVRGSAAGDLVGRDAKGRLLVFAGSGAANGKTLVPMGRSFPNANLLLNVGDWNGDGKGDVMSRSTAGVMYLLRGQGTGAFAAPVTAGTGFGSVRLLAAVGDLTGDGYPDLMGQPSGGVDADLPEQRLHRLPLELRGVRRGDRHPAGRDGAVERRRLARQPGAAQRRVAGALLRQRPRRPDRRRRGSAPSAAATTGCWRSGTSPATGGRTCWPGRGAPARCGLLPGTSTGFGARKLFMRRPGALRPRRLRPRAQPARRSRSVARSCSARRSQPTASGCRTQTTPAPASERPEQGDQRRPGCTGSRR